MDSRGHLMSTDKSEKREWDAELPPPKYSQHAFPPCISIHERRGPWETDSARRAERSTRSNKTHLPPPIAVDVVLLNDFYTVSGLEVDFIRILGNEVE